MYLLTSENIKFNLFNLFYFLNIAKLMQTLFLVVL
mgnify:CR=1 FL=1